MEHESTSQGKLGKVRFPMKQCAPPSKINVVQHQPDNRATLLSYFEEEGVNRDPNRGNVIRIEQGLRSKVAIALIHDILREVGHVGSVICREHAIEIFTNCH